MASSIIASIYSEPGPMPEWLKREWQRRGIGTVVLGVGLLLANLLLSAYSGSIKLFLDTYAMSGASNVFQAALQTNFLVILAFLCLLWSAIKYGFSEIRDKSLVPQLTSAQSEIAGNITGGFSQIAQELRNAITNTVPEIMDATTLMILEHKIYSRDTLEKAAVLVNRRLYGGDSKYAHDYANYLQSDLITCVKDSYPFFRVDFSVSGRISDRQRIDDDNRINYEAVYKYDLHPANGQLANGLLPAKIWINCEEDQIQRDLDNIEFEVIITSGRQIDKIMFDEHVKRDAIKQLLKTKTAATAEPFAVNYAQQHLIVAMKRNIAVGKEGATVNISMRSLVNREDRFQTITTSMPTRNADIRLNLSEGLPEWHFTSVGLSSMSMPVRPIAPHRFECVLHNPRSIWYRVNDWLMPGIMATAEWNFPR